MFTLARRFTSLIKNSESILKNSRVVKENLLPCSISLHHNFCTEVSNDEPDIQAVTNGDVNLEHKFKVILLEVEVMRQDGRNVPSNSFMKLHFWQELLGMETRTARRKYLDYLFKVQMTKENKVQKQQERKLEREQSDFVPNIKGALRYDLSHNNIFLRFYDTTINHMYNNRLVQAMQFSQKIVVDCGYYDQMTRRENSLCGKQLMLLFSDNRAHDEPFDIHFCNANRESEIIKTCERHIPTMYEPDFPMNVHESSYLDLFPKEKLVYLTPNARHELREFDHDAIYIIGGIVDKVNVEPISLAKAKREGLQMAKLPLDRYLQWGAGSGKALTLNHIISILLDVRKTGDWEFALRHVPKRKLVEYSLDKEVLDIHRKQERYTRSCRSWKPQGNVEKSKESKDRLIKVRSIMYD